MRSPVLLMLLSAALVALAALAAPPARAQGPDAPAPPVVRAEDWFNPLEVAEGQSHGRDVRLIFVAQLAMQLGVLLLLLRSQAGFQFRLWSATEAGGRPWIMTALMGLGTAVLSALAALPLDFFGGFILPQRHGLSTQSMESWFLTWLLSTALASAGFTVAALAVYRCIARWPGGWWLPAGVLLSAGATLFYWLAPVAIAPLFNEFRPLEDRALAEDLRGLAARAGLPVEEVLVMDASRRTLAANAYVTGLWGTRRIVLYDTLLRRFTPAEVRSVVAHELGHWRHEHIPKGLAVTALGLMLGALVAWWLLRAAAASTWFEFYEADDPAGMPFLLLVALALSVAALPLGNALSREFEREADRYALELTGDRDAFVGVERTLAVMNRMDVKPPRWAVVLLSTHPPVLERMAMALAFQPSKP